MTLRGMPVFLPKWPGWAEDFLASATSRHPEPVVLRWAITGKSSAGPQEIAPRESSGNTACDSLDTELHGSDKTTSWRLGFEGLELHQLLLEYIRHALQ